jgi:hypothetical protein
VRAVLDCGADIEVDGVIVELVGLQVYYTESQYGQHKNSEEFCRARAEVGERGVLTQGEHEVEAGFEIPTQFSATYLGKKVRIEWEIRVRVDIPWWPDAKAAFSITVVPRPQAVEPGTRKVWSSRPEGAQPKKAYVELSLGDTQVEPGGVVDGAVALGNVEFNEYRGLDVALVAVERIEAGLFTSHLHTEVARWRLPLDRPGEHEPVRFTLRLPNDLVPAFSLSRVGLEWFLRVDVDVAWSLDPRVWVPIQIRPRGSEQLALAPAPLAVGAERIELVWREVADKTGFNFVDGVLRRQAGHTEVEIRREHRGKRGVRVVADVEVPDLGMDLGWDASWGSAGSLTARDEGQISALREHLGDAFDDLEPVSVDDRLLRFELDDSGQRVEPLVPFVSGVFQIARGMEDARVEIPPPAALADDLARWQRAAAGVGGQLRTCAMRITGSREEMPFWIRPSFKPSGDVDRLVVSVRPVAALDARHHLRWRAGEPAFDAGEVAREELLELAERCASLEIQASEIQVELDPAHTSIEDAVSVLERTLALARRLTGRVGPYR